MVPGLRSDQGGTSIPTYASLVHWTEQGIKNYTDTMRRLEHFTKLAESKGGRVREALYTVGEYDIVIVTEFPDDETATAALLQVGSLGNVRTNTMRAFTADVQQNHPVAKHSDNHDANQCVEHATGTSA
jgi:uncharacterized protein with GYD domain